MAPLQVNQGSEQSLRVTLVSLHPFPDAVNSRELTTFLWPIVREMIKTAIENNQNLIVEGCYIPLDWRQDFDERYLPSIRFICLAMTDEYIDAHFDEIMEHASAIESRLDDTSCTAQGLKADNQAYIHACHDNAEHVAIIDSDFELSMQEILARF